MGNVCPKEAECPSGEQMYCAEIDGEKTHVCIGSNNKNLTTDEQTFLNNKDSYKQITTDQQEFLDAVKECNISNVESTNKAVIIGYNPDDDNYDGQCLSQEQVQDIKTLSKYPDDIPEMIEGLKKRNDFFTNPENCTGDFLISEDMEFCYPLTRASLTDPSSGPYEMFTIDTRNRVQFQEPTAETQTETEAYKVRGCPVDEKPKMNWLFIVLAILVLVVLSNRRNLKLF